LTFVYIPGYISSDIQESGAKSTLHYFKTRPKNPLKKKQALIAIANKLMFALIKKNESYKPGLVLGEIRESHLKEVA